MVKQNLLLLHGALGSKAQLSELKNSLSEKFNVYDLNFYGHGDVKSDQAFSIVSFSNNVFDFLDKNEIEQTHIFGYSMGGYVALRLAYMHPERVEKIITLGTKFNWTPETAEKEIKKLNPDVIEEKVPSFAKYLESLHPTNFWKNVVNKTATMMIEMGNGEKLKDEELQEIKHSVLVCLGDQDNMVGVEESHQAAHHLQNSEFNIINNCKHPIEKVDKGRLSEIITAYLEKG